MSAYSKCVIKQKQKETNSANTNLCDGNVVVGKDLYR